MRPYTAYYIFKATIIHPESSIHMTTQEVANRYIALYKQGKVPEIRDELYSS